jgi:hypothetical protein
VTLRSVLESSIEQSDRLGAVADAARTVEERRWLLYSGIGLLCGPVLAGCLLVAGGFVVGSSLGLPVNGVVALPVVEVLGWQDLYTYEASSADIVPPSIGWALLAALALDAAYVVVVAPVLAATQRRLPDGRASRPGDAGGGRGTRRVIARAAGYRLAALPVWIVALPVACGLYLAVATPVEALGYALGLGTVPPLTQFVAALVGTILVARGVGTVVLGAHDPDPGGETEGPTLLGSVRQFRTRPLVAVIDATVVRSLTVVPGVILLSVVWVGLTGLSTAGPATWATIIVAGVGALLVAPVTHAVAAVYRLDVVHRDGAGVESEAGTTSGERRRRVALSVLLVAGLVVGSVAVRTAEVRPGDRVQQPGPVGDDPETAILAAGDALGQTSHTIRTVREVRRVYPGNDSTTDWVALSATWVESDYPDRRFRGAYVPNGTGADYWYADDSVFAQTRGAAADPREYRPNDTGPAYAFAALRLASGRSSTQLDWILGEGDHDLVRSASWRTVDRADGTVTVVSNDSAAVRAMTLRTVDTRRSVYRSGTVQVELDADTGWLSRVSVQYSTDDHESTVEGESDPPGYDQFRVTAVVYGYRTTDVSGGRVPRRPVHHVLDAVVY